MARQRSNLLLGRGETLLTKTKWPRGRSNKEYFYSLADQQEVLGRGLQTVIADAPAAATAVAPRGEVTAKVTLHPEFVAKSYFPTSIMREAGVRVVGSRATEVTPRAMSKQRSPKPSSSAELFITGNREAFKHFGRLLSRGELTEGQTKELRSLESIAPYRAADRLRLDPNRDSDWYEAVLHAEPADHDIIDAFETLVKNLGGHIERVRHVPGLAFVPLRLPKKGLAKLAVFSHLRVLRTMPLLSGDAATETQTALTGLFDAPPTLPRGNASASDLRVGIFDGGVLPGAFAPWVTEVLAKGVPAATADDVEHGTQVTSAYLFGPVPRSGGTLPIPYTAVDHVRVLPSRSKDERVIDVIDRVMRTLEDAKRAGRPYALANLSLGPKVPMADDDVHEWTVRLDQWLANNNTLMFIAAGNDGELDQDLGRVQPPADAINAVSIGASDSCAAKWDRAPYSSWGPGRSPGFVKPDGVAFGGSQREPLRLYHPMAGTVIRSGTSYSSPIAMRCGGGVLARVDSGLSAAALQALMVASSDFSGRKHDRIGVGWGRFQQNPEDVLYSPDDEARVIYQGEMEPGQPLRARIPVPSGLPECAVEISATFCYRAPTDPAHPVNYTRAGLVVRFRPDGLRSQSFFAKSIYDTEVELRRDALRWDTCMHRTRRFTSSSMLTSPCFDINYQTREEGRPMPMKHQPKLPFALVVRIRAEGVSDIVQRIRAQYKTLAPVRLRSATRTRT